MRDDDNRLEEAVEGVVPTQVVKRSFIFTPPKEVVVLHGLEVRVDVVSLDEVSLDEVL